MGDANATAGQLLKGQTYTIPAGYHDGTGKVSVASDILSGKTAWINGSLVTGSMTNRGSLNWKPTTSTTYTVPAGYYSGGTLDSSAAYNAGVSHADGRVNTNSASYKAATQSTKIKKVAIGLLQGIQVQQVQLLM